MSPLCHTAGCSNYREGNTPYCASCNHRQRKEARTLSAPVKLNAKIKPVADKRAKELSKYSRLKAQYIAIHQICENIGCNQQATTIHHMAGRENEMLLDVNYFKALCFDCHRKVEENPHWAKENKLSESRTNKATMR